MAIGEAGSITTNSPTENAPITVTFDQALTDPVIVLTGTNVGGNAYNLRVIDIQTDVNGDATGFTFIMEEWEYLDGPHGATETINFLAIEEGVHTLPDGRIIEAGTTSATSGNSTVGLAGGFTDPPVVLTSVMSNNDTTAVDSDAWNISASGFTVSLQEEEAEDDNHAAETVGFIAIAGGFGAVVQGGLAAETDTVGLGGVFTTPISVADTQTMNGGDPANVMIAGGDGSTTIDLWLQEEQSGDSEINHINEDVGVITFDDGVILCFTPDTLIDTPKGPREITTLGQGDLVLTVDNGPQPLRLVMQTTLQSPPADLAPILIRANAFGQGMPDRDMRVSPQHRILLTGWHAQLLFGCDEVLAPAKGLLNDHTITRDTSAKTAQYIHLGLDRHHIVQTQGLYSESLHLGHLSKSALDGATREEMLNLFPDLRCAPAAWGPTARKTLTVTQARMIA